MCRQGSKKEDASGKSGLLEALENMMDGVDFEFGGWGDLSILEKEEPDHYVIKAIRAITKAKNGTLDE